MNKSGLADSPFFTKTLSDTPAQTLPAGKIQKEQPPDKGAEASDRSAQEKTVEKKAANEEPVRASMHARKHAYMQTNIQTSMHATMQPYLSEKATNSFAFRYPPALLEKLADVLHDVRKQHHRKLTKNAVAVVALTFLLTDFEAYGEESVLYQLLIQSDS